MAFVYDKLWDLLKERGMSKSDLRDKIGSSQTTMVNMGNNVNVSLNIIDRICQVLFCTPDDIMEYIVDGNRVGLNMARIKYLDKAIQGLSEIRNSFLEGD